EILSVTLSADSEVRRYFVFVRLLCVHLKMGFSGGRRARKGAQCWRGNKKCGAGGYRSCGPNGPFACGTLMSVGEARLYGIFDSNPTGKMCLRQIGRDHYGSGKAPADWLKINPVFFPVISPFTNRSRQLLHFGFYIGMTQKTKLSECSDWKQMIPPDCDAEALEKKNADLTYLAGLWLEYALTHRGVGAKTALSYGIFDGE
ncbi:MAG: hypothetical protein R3C61_27525, partial [Bacteroidia bacterium]